MGPMSRHIFRWLFWCIILSKKVFADTDKPHIIFILADDLGWNDVGFHGMKDIPTPNMDALAADGVRLRNYYGAPMCTPSRAALHTGKYPSRLGLQHYVIPDTGPWGLSLDVPTLADKLAELGYVNRLVGKWHLGFYQSRFLPTNRGYESHYGFWTGALDYFTHNAESRSRRSDYDNVPQDVLNENISFEGHNLRDDLTPREDQSGEYLTDLLTQRAVDIIAAHNTSRPLHLMLTHHAPHRGNTRKPVRAPDRYIHRFQHLSDETRKHFAGSLTALDDSLGQVIRALSLKQMLSDSLVIFASDNGADVTGFTASGGSNWPLRGQKATPWEGGVRLPAVVWSARLQHPGRSWEGLAHATDWFPTLYAAAGGDTRTLVDLDGHDLWKAIAENLTFPRNEVLLVSDPILNVQALRSGDYKLITGTLPNLEGWPSVDARNASVHFLDDRKSLTETVLADFRGYGIVSGQQEVTCAEQPTEGRLSECGQQNGDDICLFDLRNDPCEYTDISAQYPQVVEEILIRLRIHREMASPPLNRKRDYLSNPQYYNRSWTPWQDHLSPD